MVEKKFSPCRSAISVIIPTYNRVQIIERAVRSALAAVRPGDEIIVVDDGSTDGTSARLMAYADRIRYVGSEHVGSGTIRNIGIREARAPLVAFLDSDDEWMPDKLELQREVMDRCPQALFCFSDFGHRSRLGEETRRYLSSWHPEDRRDWSEILGPGFPFSHLAPLPQGRPDFVVHVGDMYLTALLGDYICTSTVIVRRKEAGGALRFAEDLLRFQDSECFGRLARAGLAAYLDCDTQWNCDHDGPRLTHADVLYRQAARITVLQRVWGSDPDFLARHASSYQTVLSFHQRVRAKELLAAGRSREAREEFRRAGSMSLIEWALTALPGPVAQAIVRARRRLMQIVVGVAALVRADGPAGDGQ